ncbi:MAG: hypothetical protein ABIA11_00580 [Patescibacteria group bacterium]
MAINPTSELLFALLLKLIDKNPSLVSELWISEAVKKKIKAKYEKRSVNTIRTDLENSIDSIENPLRKEYLSKITKSIVFQLSNSVDDFDNFYVNCLDYAVTEISEYEVKLIHDRLKKYEAEYGLFRHDVILSLKLSKDELLPRFKRELIYSKDKLPDFLNTTEEFNYEVVTDKPWAAFNRHIEPFKSTLSLNADSGLTSFDMKQLAVHEGYGGHHTELSLKDNFLVEEGRLEHGFVLIYSPQSFISEGLAEAAYKIFGFDESLNNEEYINFLYQELFSALMNKVTFLYLKHGLAKTKVVEYLKTFDLGTQGIKNMTAFVFDKLYGKYAAVYYSAKKFILEQYTEASNKDEFLKFVYMNPCTPTSIRSLEFDSK